MLRLIILFLLINAPLSAAQSTINWLTDDNRDLSDLLLDKQVSIGTDTINLVLKSLPQYQFDFQYASLSRINHLLTNVNNTCVGNRIKTPERSAQNIFSLPVNIHPTYRLYYLKDNVQIPSKLINKNGELTSLNALFEVLPNKILGVAKGQSYGKQLDAQISSSPNANIMIRAGDDRYNTISRLFFKKRVDLVIDFPSQFQSKIKQYRQQANTASIRIANIDQFIISHIACNTSDSGKAFIKDVNIELQKLYKNNLLLEAHLAHIPESNHEQLKKFFHQKMNVATKVQLTSLP